jgi:hypothetical protein
MARVGRWCGLLVLAGLVSGCATNLDRVRTSLSDHDWQQLTIIESDLLAAELNHDQAAFGRAAAEVTAFRSQELLNETAQATITGLAAWQAWLAGNSIELAKEQTLLQAQAAGSEWQILAEALAFIAQKKTGAAQHILLAGVTALDKAPRLKLRLAILANDLRDVGRSLSYLDAALRDYPKQLANQLLIFRQVLLNAAQLALQSSIGTAVSQKATVTFHEMLGVILSETKLPWLVGIGPTAEPDSLLQAMITAQIIPDNRFDLNAAVLRGGFGNLVWRLMVSYGPDTKLESRYQAWVTRVAEGLHETSLIPDVPADQPLYFIAKWLVEREIMTLPDGQNFFPDRTISGLDMLNSLRVLERELATKLDANQD